MDPDPFGRAIRDHYLGTQDEPLIDRDGGETREHAIQDWYFGEHDEEAWRDQWMKGPLLDMGAGVGRDAIHYQEQFETVAIEVSEYLVETMCDRGVKDARYADMFALRDYFGPNRFQSAHAIGTQVGLVASMAGLRRFLDDLDFVTSSDATAIIDNYAPENEATKDVFAFRPDPADGLAFRVFHNEYKGEVSRTLLFRLFSIDRLQEATSKTSWKVIDVEYGEVYWRAILEKS